MADLIATMTALSPILRRCINHSECQEWTDASTSQTLVGTVKASWDGTTKEYQSSSRIEYTWPKGYSSCGTLTIGIPYKSSSFPARCKAFFTTKNLGTREVYSGTGWTTPSAELSTGFISESTPYINKECTTAPTTSEWESGKTLYFKFDLSQNRMSPGTVYYVYIVRNSTRSCSFYGKGQSSIISILTHEKEYTITYKNLDGTEYASDLVAESSTYEIKSTGPHKQSDSSSVTVLLDSTGGTLEVDTLTTTNVTEYTLSGWVTSLTGGVEYVKGNSYTINSDLILYPKYSSNVTMGKVELPSPERPGYKFVGWSTESTATSGVTGDYETESNTILYAIWKYLATVFAKVDKEYIAGTPWVKVGNEWKKAKLVYIKVNGEWKTSIRDESRLPEPSSSELDSATLDNLILG